MLFTELSEVREIENRQCCTNKCYRLNSTKVKKKCDKIYLTAADATIVHSGHITGRQHRECRDKNTHQTRCCCSLHHQVTHLLS